MGQRLDDDAATATCARCEPLDWRTNASADCCRQCHNRRSGPASWRTGDDAGRGSPVAGAPDTSINRGHRAGKPALGRHLPNHVLAVPGPPPDMGKSKEVEAGSIRLRMSRVLWSLWAEVDEARLVGMESKSI